MADSRFGFQRLALLQVVPALGAEQMVAFCGGIYAVLVALRVDVRAAFLPEGLQSRDGQAQGLLPVAFPWEQYGAVVTALRRKGRDTPDLLGKAGTIPDSALKAMRCGVLRPFTACQAPATPMGSQRWPWRHFLLFQESSGSLSCFQRKYIDVCRGQRQILSSAEVDARLKSMPATLAKALLPFQTEGVRFGIQHGGRMLLADEMGVGKTVQAIALASCYQVVF